MPSSRNVAVRAARAASDKMARDIRVLEVRDLIGITDYFVVASGATDRQVRAIGEAIQEELSNVGVKIVRREGERDLRWLLLDYVDVVVHVFLDEARSYYELERLWKDAPDVAWEPDEKSAQTGKRAEG